MVLNKVVSESIICAGALRLPIISAIHRLPGFPGCSRISLFTNQQTDFTRHKFFTVGSLALRKSVSPRVISNNVRRALRQMPVRLQPPVEALLTSEKRNDAGAVFFFPVL